MFWLWRAWGCYRFSDESKEYFFPGSIEGTGEAGRGGRQIIPCGFGKSERGKHKSEEANLAGNSHVLCGEIIGGGKGISEE